MASLEQLRKLFEEMEFEAEALAAARKELEKQLELTRQQIEDMELDKAIEHADLVCHEVMEEEELERNRELLDQVWGDLQGIEDEELARFMDQYEKDLKEYDNYILEMEKKRLEDENNGVEPYVPKPYQHMFN